jgi:ArsR family transcriptional regulator, arsenate/arsenite/antimonite-responsive transcriptional repressor
VTRTAATPTDTAPSEPAAACCAPVMHSPLGEADAEELAGAFKVLADPVRLRLLSFIAARDGETCACELVDVLDRSQPTISHHLAVLHDAGLLSREKRGRWVWYRTVPDRIAAVRDSLAAR